MNHMLHIAAATQIRLDTEGRAYYRRKLAEGKTRMEAMRCLKRRISDAIYRQLLADAQAVEETGPGGHCGATQESFPRTSTLRISHFPDPQTRRYRQRRFARTPKRPRQPAVGGGAQEPSRWSAPPDERP